MQREVVEREAPEHKVVDLDIEDQTFLTYLDQFLEENFRDSRGERGISIYEINKVRKIENSSYAGIIAYGDFRLKLSTKVKANLFYMLTFLKRSEAMQTDLKRIIDIEEGDCFFDALARFFLNELNTIVEKGLLKRYVREEENLCYLKGKLLLNDHLRNNLSYKPKLYCSYFNLTYDNRENRIVLRSLNLLTSLVRYNPELKIDLMKAQRDLLAVVELDMGISPSDCDQVCIDRLNQHYENIIPICRLILEETFIRSTQAGRSKGFNFIVDMNQLYEDFLTAMFQRVVQERYSRRYQVVDQRKFRTLDRQGTIETRPDILLYDLESEKYSTIVDAKYKLGLHNADAYQMIAYSLALPDSKACCLIYPESEGAQPRVLEIRRNLTTDSHEDFPLVIRTIRLFDIDNESYAQFTNRVKDQIGGLIEELQNPANIKR